MYIPVGYTWEYPRMTRSTVFLTNRSQAARLPKSVVFPDGVHQVEIVKLGHSRLINPVGRRLDDLSLDGPRASDDFMSERRQPDAEEREPL
jgi:antitoxin VapB